MPTAKSPGGSRRQMPRTGCRSVRIEQSGVDAMDETQRTADNDEFYSAEDRDRLERMRQEAARRRDDEAREHDKARHWMHCPKCGAELVEESCDGVRAAMCRVCEGLWLDREAVEALIAGSSSGLLERFRTAARAKVPSGADEA